MKTLIILSLLMVGCIVEPRPEDYKNYLTGKWENTEIATVYIVVNSYKVDATFNDGISGIAKLSERYGGMVYKRFLYINDTLIVKSQYRYDKFVRKNIKN